MASHALGALGLGPAYSTHLSSIHQPHHRAPKKAGKHVVLQLNSLGDEGARARYSAALQVKHDDVLVVWW